MGLRGGIEGFAEAHWESEGAGKVQNPERGSRICLGVQIWYFQRNRHTLDVYNGKAKGIGA